ncbi:MAG: GNAT family N-acetyltransferase [Lachnospiraceae bacterium]|nr:GNAT family N-acetyltransferase [Lachnospiraceae bacterium]
MSIILREMRPEDMPAVLEIWNQVVEEGGSIPFEEPLDEGFLGMILADAESYVAVETSDSGEAVIGMYCVHPNILGRCSHVANATYLVAAGHRGKHIGGMMVLDSIEKTRKAGFRAIQFNGVVKSNVHAVNLYKRCGFEVVGEIPESFRVKDGHYENGLVMYRKL